MSKGSLVVTVDGSALTAEVEYRILEPLLIIEQGETKLVNNWKLYSGIGGGLGVALVLGVVISVVLGVIIFYYHR